MRTLARTFSAALLVALLAAAAHAYVTTRAVTGTIRKPDGTAWASAKITFKLDKSTYTSTDAFPVTEVEASTNSSGVFSVALWCNAEGAVKTLYTATLPDGSAFQFRLAYGDGSPVDISVLRAGGIAPAAPADPLYVSVQALVAAHEAAPDPHTQYLTPAEGDARYSQLGHAHAAATTSADGFMSAADKTKLDSVAPGATANSTDAQLRDRSTHTGAQAISTVTGLQAALDAKEPAVAAGTTSQYWRGDKTFQTLDTGAVPENGNLYWTASRFNSSFGGKTTADLAEGSNLYFTNARADGRIAAALGVTVQPLNANLTAFGALTPNANDVLQYKSGAWANRTPAQLKTDLSVQFSDLGGSITTGQQPSTTVNSVVNDTNVQGSISAQALTLSWAGALGKSRQHAATVYNDQANTYSAGAQDFGSASSLKVPSAAGASPSAAGQVAYDSTANLYKGFNGTSLKTFAFTDSNITGNAATATALAANGSNCSAGNAAAGVDASGAAEGCAALPANTSSTASQFFTAYNSTTGAFTKAQPSGSDLSLSDVTTNNASSSAHGFLPKLSGSASDVFRGDGTYSAVGVPAYARVTGSNATTTSATLSDVTGLTVALAANATYEVEAWVSANSSDTNGIQYALQYSAAGATVEAGLIGTLNATAVRTDRLSAFNSASGNRYVQAAIDGEIIIRGVVTTGSNAGNLTVQHSKATAGTATERIGSYLKVTKIQ